MKKTWKPPLHLLVTKQNKCSGRCLYLLFLKTLKVCDFTPLPPVHPTILCWAYSHNSFPKCPTWVFLTTITSGPNHKEKEIQIIFFFHSNHICICLNPSPLPDFSLESPPRLFNIVLRLLTALDVLEDMALRQVLHQHWGRGRIALCIL